MRIWTLGVSIVVHAIAIAALVAVPLFATGALPTPRQLTTFIDVFGELPHPPTPVARRPVRDAARSDMFPITEPDVFPPDQAIEPIGDLSFGILVPPATDLGSGPGHPVGPEPEPAVVSQPAPLVRAGGVIVPPHKIHHVAPKYPAIAQSARVEGMVIVEAIIGTNGLVQDVRVLRSAPLLDEAAVDAVWQWRYTPTLLNGMPVRVVMTVTVAFSLR